MSVYEPDVVRKLLAALEPKDSQQKFETSWKSSVKKCVESWTGHNDRMTNPRPRCQYEWEAEIVEYINYVSDKTRVRSAKALTRPCLDSKIPLLGPHFVPPSYLHALRRHQPELAVNPETLYLKPLWVIHPFYYSDLAHCPRCNCTDSVRWDGWTGTGAIGTQLCCENCKNDPKSKKVGQQQSSGERDEEGDSRTQLKGHCFATTNPEFWHNWAHWSIPIADIPIFFRRCAVTHELFDLLIELRLSSTAGGLAENIRPQHPELHLLEFNRGKLAYLQALKSRRTARCGMDYFSPNLLQLFSDPGDTKNYNDKPISNDVITEVFQEFASGSRERESEDYLWTLSGKSQFEWRLCTMNLLEIGISVSFDNTFRAVGKALVTSRDKQKIKVLKGGIISLMNENGEIIGWFCHGQSNTEITELLDGLKARCEELDVPPPEIFVADNCCHVCSAVTIIFPQASMKLDVWHFIMRYAATVLNSSRNPCQKEVVAEISACILKKHAQGKNPAEYWDRHEQEKRLSDTFEKWSTEGMVWSAGACRDIRTDGSRIEGSHKGWNSLQQVHSSGITTFTALCHDFVLRQNIRVASSRKNKSDFLSSTYGSHHVHLVDGIARLFNSLQHSEKSASSTHPLPELMQLSSKEHFGLVESIFASTFGGLLDIKTEDSELGDTDSCTNLLNEITNDDHTETILQSARSEIINELDIDPQLLSMPQPPTCEPPASMEPRQRAKRKADDSEESRARQGPPHKLLRQTETSQGNIPAEVPMPEASEVAASLLNKPTATGASTQHQLPTATPDSTPPDPVAVISPAAINSAATLAPILRPPGMTRSQHFFTIATRINAHAMQISGDIEFHLFMDMRVEFTWISFKMTPKQWAVATETYNDRLEEKSRASGLEMVKKKTQALLRKLGEIEVAVMNHVAKNDFKSRSGSETFWRRHCHAIELIKTEPGKKIRKAHTCSRCKTIMYPGPENSGYNHRRGFCADGAKQVSKNEPPPPWPQPPGIFSEGKHFHPCAFLETIKQIYKQVFLRPSGESPALEQEAFATMLLDRSTTLESGTVLFKLYEELEIDGTTPDALLTVHNGVKHLRIEYLQEHWAS
ncbi:hypothetical protein DFH29DRAFT_878740 [Suillus ampliporus]|nr:hypothetical protein DFH29DRAFT_878740 [Suillus ampliporus]